MVTDLKSSRRVYFIYQNMLILTPPANRLTFELSKRLIREYLLSEFVFFLKYLLYKKINTQEGFLRG